MDLNVAPYYLKKIVELCGCMTIRPSIILEETEYFELVKEMHKVATTVDSTVNFLQNIVIKDVFNHR